LARIDPEAWNEAAKVSYWTQDYRLMGEIIAGALIKRDQQE
jgi:hypothetical protein